MNLIEDIIRHSKLPLTFTVSASHNRQSQILKKMGGVGGGGGQKKNECLGGLRVPATDICLGGAYYVPSQKRIRKMKYGFEGSIFECHSWLVLAKQHINV